MKASWPPLPGPPHQGGEGEASFPSPAQRGRVREGANPRASRAESPETLALAGALAHGLLLELRLTPKPGLVDLEDSGSHRDLTYALMERSVGLVHGYFREVAASLSNEEPLARQVALGRAAERRMLLELGANTHKGAIFLGGLLLAARHRAAEDGEAALRRAIAGVARELLALAGGREPPGPATPASPPPTHGAEARQRFGVGGILREAAAGLPSLFEVALPAFRAARRAGRDPETAAFATLASLMRAVEDTTALHRCGLPGLALLREDGRALAALLESGRDHLAFLRERNRAWRELNLTMGGVADLLGVALGWLAWRGELPPAQGR